MTFWNGFRTWNLQSVLSERAKSNEANQLHAALSAEDKIVEELKNAGCSDVFPQKRIFVSSVNHCREIDVIAILDHTILVVEVKNWSGAIWRNGSRWFQLVNPTRTALEFEDLVEEVTAKCDALKKFLENQHKIQLPEGKSPAITPCIVFANERSTLDPRTVKNMPNVFDLASFRAYALAHCGGPKGAVASATDWLLSFVWAPETPLSPLLKERTRKALGKVKTWDLVTLHNGTVFHGDIVGIEAPSHNFAYERKHVQDIVIEWTTMNAWGLAKSLWNGSAGFLRICLVEQKRRKKKNDKKPRDAEGNIACPIRLQTTKDVFKLDRLLVRRAGRGTIEPYALSDVRRVELSQHHRKEK